MACGALCIVLAVWVTKSRRQVDRIARRLQEDARTAKLARTSHLVVTEEAGATVSRGSVQLAFALELAAHRGVFHIAPGVRIEGSYVEVGQKQDAG